MKFSLNSIRGMNERYKCTGDIAAIGVDKLVDKIGQQLGEIESVDDIGKKYNGIVIVKVMSCEDHPNADKLHVCKIDDDGKTPKIERDSDGYVQVVCGAPNVREGLLVAWLPPGATVPSTVGKDPFVLEVRELRGIKSNGMLASPAELAIGDNHEGILEIDNPFGKVKVGGDFAETFELKNDVVIDIENKMLTHRPDCFGFLGVSRELAGIQQMQFKSPSWYTPNPKFTGIETDDLKLEVKNELPELVPRFTAIAMSGINVGPSPVWLQVELAKIGLKSINNIVDYTNFFMLETGQPLHAYDYDKVKALSEGSKATIVIRHPKKGEKLKLLNSKELEPRPEAIMIATDQKLIGVGGVMGGSDTEVDENTKNIILECATFDMYSIRRTSMEHGLFTDAVTRFTKGQSPLQNLAVLAKIVDEIGKQDGGKVASPVVDNNHAKATRRAVHVTAKFINERLGLELKPAEIKKLLENVEFTAYEEKGTLAVTAPFWRTDIEIAEDVVEEVGRLYGYDHLPLELPRRSLAPAPSNALLDIKAQVRNVLASAGANELTNYSFVHGDLLTKVGQNPKSAFRLSNALSPDLQHYRLSLLPSLLDKVHANIKAGYNRFALFEIGQIHSKDLIDQASGLPIEEHRLALVFAADDKTAKAEYAGAPYYQAQKYLRNLLSEFGINSVFEPATSHEPRMAVGRAAIAPFERGRAAYVKTKDGKLLGELGEFTASVRSHLKLPQFVAGFELDIQRLLEESGQNSSYDVLPRFPKVSQDITLKVSAELSYQELFDFALSEISKNQPPDTLPSLGPIDIYQKPTDKKHKQISLRLSIASYKRTLTGTEVAKLLDGVAEAVKQKFGAERI